MTSNIKKLTLYCIDCIKACGRSSAFNNLRSNKDNKILITSETSWASDCKEVIEIMTLAALNKSTMSIIKGALMAEGVIKKEKFYSPLLYCEAELKRDGYKIRLEYDNDNIEINYSLLSSLLDNDSEIVENVVNQLMEIENPEQIDFISVLKGLMPNINGLTIKKENAVILAKSPESVAGLINELKQISEIYTWQIIICIKFKKAVKLC